MPTGRPTDYTPEIGAIYGLYDKSGVLRYIGKARDPKARLKGHMRDSVKRDTPVYRWIRKNGLPEMRILEENCIDWRVSEKRLIVEAKARGEKLLNVAEGGEQPFCSQETRSANGRNSKAWARHHDRIRTDTLYALIQRMKMNYPRMLRIYEKLGQFDKAQEYRVQMHKMAKGWPEKFGKWANA